MKTPLALVLALGLAFWYRQRSQEEGSAQIVTAPYTLLKDKSAFDGVHFGESYDSRKFPLGVLQYLASTNDEVIPVRGWGDVLNITGKTELGRYWLDQHKLSAVILMKEGLDLYPVMFGCKESVLEHQAQEIDSVPDFINSTLHQARLVRDYNAIDLTAEDFKLGIPHQEMTHFRYFKEGVLLNQKGLAHYEVRFYESKLLPIDRVATLHRIIRAWARFTEKRGITTWLAHGNLLGYFFNGLIFPWDDDLDVQVTAKSFAEVVKLNQTLVVDYNDHEAIGSYLIDVNPWFASRERNSDNKIDARFIDIDTGLYIDITTLTSELSRMDIIDSFDEEERAEFYKIFNPYHDDVVTELESYESEIQQKANKLMLQGSLISCKDYHFYDVEELTPLIPTIFEGAVVYVPNNIEQLLLREYKRRSLYLHRFKGFTYDKFTRTWCHPKIASEYNPIMKSFIEQHYKVMQQTFKRHIFNVSLLTETPTFRTGLPRTYNITN